MQISFEYHSIRPCNKDTIREEETQLYFRYSSTVLQQYKGSCKNTIPFKNSIIPHL